MDGKRYRFFVCLLLSIVLLTQLSVVCRAEEEAGGPTGARVDPVGQNDRYSAILYNNTNGLPTSEANDIAETRDGFLWIGSYSGLIRYDGNTFERMDSTTGIANVGCLYVDSRDRLWVGTNDSGVAVMDQGQFRMWREENGLKSTKIRAITEDENGVIYVGTTEGIVTIDPKGTLRALDDPRVSDVYVDQLRRSSDGTLYGMSNDDDIFTLRDGKVESYLSHLENPVDGIVKLLPDRKEPGKVYLGTDDAKLYSGTLDRGLEVYDMVDLAPLSAVNALEQIGDELWIGALNGVGVLDETGFHPLEGLPMNNSVGNVMMDYEGNLWFTSSRQGVMKLVSNQFSDLFARYGLSETVVNSTCLSGERLFVGADTGLLVLDKNGPAEAIPLSSAVTASGRDLGAADLLELLDGIRVRSVIRDSRGRLWISTWRGCGLLRYDHGKVTAFTEEDGLLSSQIRAVCEGKDGSMLVVCSGGVCVIRGDRVAASYGKEDGIVNPESLTVAAAPNGDIVLGSNGGGIYVIGSQGTRCVGVEDGLTSGIVMRIKYDSSRDLFWIVTSNSIAYMTAEYQVTTVRSFPYSNNFDLYENSKGEMWILSSNGIYVLPVEDLLANGEIRPEHYSMANGLPCIATSNSYSELTPQGDLYIAGSTGVAKVNIDQPMVAVRDLRGAVPYVDADGLRMYPDGKGGFSIPSDVHKLTIYSYVFNYSLVDPKVSYRLEGFDRDYVTVSRSELAPLDYTNLPGGTYHFEMRLLDSQGGISRLLSVPIVKEKALYERTWFLVVLALAAALCLGAGIRHYIHRKTYLLEEKHQEEMKQELLKTELNTASQIQASMLPHTFPPFPDRTEFDIFASMDPAREVGGDFYDFFLIDEDHLCLVMADVSGKGIPAALFMMVSQVIVHSCAMLGRSAADILVKTNDALSSNNQVEMFVTVWVGILEISTGILTAANAGHEYPVVGRKGRFTTLKDKHGFVIGGMEGMQYREYQLALEPGDKLFLYTDGVPEATDGDNRMFGMDRMLEALNEDGEASPEQLLKNVRRAVDRFVQDAEQFDDLTMLCMEYKGRAD